MQVRVWWEATAPPHEEDGAAFYPAKVVRNVNSADDEDEAAFVLEFATGQCTVSAESVFPFDNPIAFGGEEEPVQVRCFVLCEFSFTFCDPPRGSL